MVEQPISTFFRSYNLSQEREYPSRKEPANHQNETLGKLKKWFEDKHSPAGGIIVLPTGGGKTFVAVRFLCTYPLSEGYKVLWLAHTHHLLEQAFYSFSYSRNNDEVNQSGSELSFIAAPRSVLNIRVISGTEGHYSAHQIKANDDVIIGTLQTIT